MIATEVVERLKAAGFKEVETVLDRAREAVDDRAGRYGDPLTNHTVTADLWSTFIRARTGVAISLTAEDVCWLNVLQKASRDAYTPGLDNLVDGCGYLRNVEIIRERRKELAF